MIRRKNALFAHFHGKLTKLKNMSRKMSRFLFNFNFLNNKKKYKKKKKNQKNYFQKKVVPAITDICTGGQQCKISIIGQRCKYQLLSSRG